MGETGTSTRQIIYEVARAASLEGWWVWALLVAVIGILLLGCVKYYLRDAAELTTPVRWTLILLRLVAIVALIFFFFDLQRRTQRMVTRSSEVVVLVDTSQSMSLPAETLDSTQSRSQRVARILGKTELIEKLSQEHRVSLYAFDDEAQPRLLETRGGEAASDATETVAGPDSGVSLIALLGAFLILITVILSIASLATGASFVPVTVIVIVCSALTAPSLSVAV